ncbi:hypothetical protein [Cellulomonas wangsupingiae]|uniref:hypothetical protein n=1 Tax=Cellulomonas wangsupingiae TaxID=2968085 RepID=UPI001D0F0ECD|nr:hypothetical protein [Cellulomonas wangsupingiae]MCM0641456.1 hypothetical protein [Cellulomonas wangsupingiae]
MRAGIVTVVVALLASCTWGTADDAAPATPSASATPEPVAVTPLEAPAPATVVDGDDAAAALATSAALLDAAPVVVLAAAGDVPGTLTAATAAVALGAPALLTGADADVASELARLGARHALVVGDVDPAVLPDDVVAVAVPSGAGADVLSATVGRPLGEPTPVPAGGEAAAVRALAAPEPAVLVAEGATATASADPAATPGDQEATVLPPTTAVTVPGVLALADGPVPPAAGATLRALGVDVLDVPGGDPRATSAAVQALAVASPETVVAYGSSFAPADRLVHRVAAARTGAELPGGGQLVFPAVEGQPGKRYVALYGTPGSGALGVLGEQDVPATVARAEQHAAPYRGLTTDTVVPAVEIIATIASAGAEPDGSYSRKRSVEELRPLVEAAGAAGQYVVLDLQPGHQDFVTQAQLYTDLLALPHVGLALDPEWRLAPGQVHLRQIGSVGIDEVNATAAWLAQLTRERALPQKMFVLHQFSLRMISERERLDTSHDELAPLIHVDGQGGQPAKAGTWAALRNAAPPVHWGWKNFYDEDVPMLDPAQTFAVQPVPDLVTYQ